MNKYRVDRNDSKSVPCGMNSIVYIGDNKRKARLTFVESNIGIDTWGQSNPDHGLTLSEHNGTDYTIVDTRGL